MAGRMDRMARVYEVLYDVEPDSAMAGRSAAADSTFIARFWSFSDAKAFAATVRGPYGSPRPTVEPVDVPRRVADRWSVQ